MCFLVSFPVVAKRSVWLTSRRVNTAKLKDSACKRRPCCFPLLTLTCIQPQKSFPIISLDPVCSENNQNSCRIDTLHINLKHIFKALKKSIEYKISILVSIVVFFNKLPDVLLIICMSRRACRVSILRLGTACLLLCQQGDRKIEDVWGNASHTPCNLSIPWLV